jgi:hypothetical protein
MLRSKTRSDIVTGRWLLQIPLPMLMILPVA